MVSVLAKILDDIANREALHARDVATMPALLEPTGIDVEDIDEETIREAERHHRNEFYRWCSQHGAVGSRHIEPATVPQDPVVWVAPGAEVRHLPPPDLIAMRLAKEAEEEDPFA